MTLPLTPKEAADAAIQNIQMWAKIHAVRMDTKGGALTLLLAAFKSEAMSNGMTQEAMALISSEFKTKTKGL